MRKMARFLVLATGLAAAVPAAAQDTGGRCTMPDSIRVIGNSRVQAANVITDAGLAPGVAANFTTVQRAIRAQIGRAHV